MAIDVITGKPIKPQFEGQRTNVDIDFDPTEWQEAWQAGRQGEVEGLRYRAFRTLWRHVMRGTRTTWLRPRQTLIRWVTLADSGI